MATTDSDVVDEIRKKINFIKDGQIHVDNKDQAHDYQTILMKLCHVTTEEDAILEMLDEILEQDPDVNIQDACGRTALAHACISQNYAIVDALLYTDSTCVDLVDKNGCTPLTYAIKSNDGHMVDKLLSHPKARNSALLSTKCNGKTPLELAKLNGNQAIIDIIKTCIKYCGGNSNSFETGRERSHSSLPSVNPMNRTRIPPVLAFAASKSHSDSVLLKRDRYLGSSMDNLQHEHGIVQGFQHPKTVESRARNKQVKRYYREDSPGNSSDELPPLGNSFGDGGQRTRTSRRRGSLSLPDLSLPLGSLSRLEVTTDNADSETTESVDNDEEDIFTDEEDFDEDLNEEEIRQRMARSSGRRKNSISLPDLRDSCGFLVSSSNSYSAPISGDRPVYSATSTTDSGIDTSFSASHNRPVINCRKKANDLHLPDIHMCNSPSLPALDTKSLTTAKKIPNSQSVQNLDLSVRKPVGGKGGNHAKLMNRRRTATMQSIT